MYHLEFRFPSMSTYFFIYEINKASQLANLQKNQHNNEVEKRRANINSWRKTKSIKVNKNWHFNRSI